MLPNTSEYDAERWRRDGIGNRPANGELIPLIEAGRLGIVFRDACAARAEI